MDTNDKNAIGLKNPNYLKKLPSETWVTSDPHYYHSRIISLSGRPFSSVEEMNETLVERHNATVGKGDTVIMMGDIVWKENYHILRRLNGAKHLILGNHDYINLNKGQVGLLDHFYSINLWKKDKSAMMLLSHVPLHESQLTTGGSMHDPNVQRLFQIHGHTHESGSPPGPYRSVCVELTDYTPVNYNELKKWSSEWHTKNDSSTSKKFAT